MDREDVVEKLEARIAALVENGENPARLEDILASFQKNMAVIEKAYADVGELIAEHAGFDEDGQVVDESLAVYTLNKIAEGLLDVHQLSEVTQFELRWDLLIYRYSSRVKW